MTLLETTKMKPSIRIGLRKYLFARKLFNYTNLLLDTGVYSLF